MRKINKGTLRTGGGHIIAYADDIVFITKKRNMLAYMLEQEELRQIGLKINDDETKVIRFDKKSETRKTKIGDHEFDKAERFEYLNSDIKW